MSALRSLAMSLLLNDTRTMIFREQVSYVHRGPLRQSLLAGLRHIQLEVGAPVVGPHPRMSRVNALIVLRELLQFLDANNLEAFEMPTPPDT